VIAICNSQTATTKKLTSAINIAFAALPTKENVMKNIARSFIGFLVALAAISAVAQNAIQVKVPFAFAAAEQTLPAGDYRVTLDRAVDRVTLRGENTGAIFFVTPSLDLKDGRSFLRFQRFGNDWVLTTAAFSGSTQELSTQKIEKRFLAQQNLADRKAMVEIPMQPLD
jgi:hypothetical protein